MTTTKVTLEAGLEGVVAATSRLCYLDGQRGILAYCGHDIHELARSATFEEVCYLLWHRRLPTRAELGDLQTELARARPLPEAVLRVMQSLPLGNTMDSVRTIVSVLAHHDPEAGDDSLAASQRKAVRLTAQIATVVATLGRLASARGQVEPDPVLSHAANFLYVLTGERPNPTVTRALDVALILHADHELNASTFAARVAAATLADLHSTIVAGIATLKGPLHGGAAESVMAMAEEIGDPAEATAYAKRVLDGHGRIMGFGHRVYRAEDPRAQHLRERSKALGEKLGQPKWIQILDALVEAMAPYRAKGIHVNVDFFAGSIYQLMGIPEDMFIPIFALGRIPGWTLQVLEQYENNILIRPLLYYEGPMDLEYVPLEARD